MDVLLKTTIDKLGRAGANHVISPNITGGVRLASMLLRPTVVSFRTRSIPSIKGSGKGLFWADFSQNHGIPGTFKGKPKHVKPGCHICHGGRGEYGQGIFGFWY